MTRNYSLLLLAVCASALLSTSCTASFAAPEPAAPSYNDEATEVHEIGDAVSLSR